MSKKRQPIRRPVLPPKRGRKPKPVAPVVPAHLTAKQQRFIEEYCVDMNATQAAIRAGYAKRGAAEEGYRLLGNVHIAAAVAKYKADLAARARRTKEDIEAELEKMGFANLANYHRMVDGEPVIDLSACGRDEFAALSELETHDYVDGRGEDARDVKKVRIKMTDKRAALMDLAKLRGHVTDKSEVTVKPTSHASIVERVRQMSDEDLAAYDELTRRQEALLKGKDASV